MRNYKKRAYRKTYPKKSTKKAVARTNLPSSGPFTKADFMLKNEVKSIVNRLSETKDISRAAGFDIVNYTGTGWSTINLFPISPYGGFQQINQGSGQADRIGNKIRVVSGNIKMMIWAKPYNGSFNATPQPCNVIIWIYSVKNNTVRPNNMTDFFQSGNVDADPTGSLLDICRSVNKDKFVLHKRVVKKIGFAQNDGTGQVVASQYYSNNDFHLNAQVNIDTTKYLPKTIEWNDTTTDPSSRLLMFAIEVVWSDGTVMPTNYIPTACYFENTIKYKDM